MPERDDIVASDGLTTNVAIPLEFGKEFKHLFRIKKIYNFYIYKKKVVGNNLIVLAYSDKLYYFIDILNEQKIEWFVP